MITDKKGLKHIYEVTQTEVVNPYDNSIKTQSTEKELDVYKRQEDQLGWSFFSGVKLV